MLNERLERARHSGPWLGCTCDRSQIMFQLINYIQNGIASLYVYAEKLHFYTSFNSQFYSIFIKILIL